MPNNQPERQHPIVEQPPQSMVTNVQRPLHPMYQKAIMEANGPKLNPIQDLANQFYKKSAIPQSLMTKMPKTGPTPSQALAQQTMPTHSTIPTNTIVVKQRQTEKPKLLDVCADDYCIGFLLAWALPAIAGLFIYLTANVINDHTVILLLKHYLSQ